MTEHSEQNLSEYTEITCHWKVNNDCLRLKQNRSCSSWLSGCCCLCLCRPRGSDETLSAHGPPPAPAPAPNSLPWPVVSHHQLQFSLISNLNNNTTTTSEITVDFWQLENRNWEEFLSPYNLDLWPGFITLLYPEKRSRKSHKLKEVICEVKGTLLYWAWQEFFVHRI